MRHFTENGKPAVAHNEVVATSPTERQQRMYVEVEGKEVRGFTVTHRRID